MAVYVDDMCDHPEWGRFGRMLMSHMIADSSEELHAMAVRIGVARRWVQHPGTHREHYDVCKSKRAKAIQLGAISIGMRELSAKITARRPAGHDTTPTRSTR